jgi:DedD protein
MADRIAESGEPAVDELKRKARRRLVGAIVLALVAAIVVPMLLENEPRPLGDDVVVQIPPRDEGRFVNRLTGTAPEGKFAKPGAPRSAAETAAVPQASAPAAPAAAPSAAPAPAVANPPSGEAVSAPVETSGTGTKKSLAEAEQRVLAPGPKPAAKSTSDAKSAPEPKSASKSTSDAKSAPEPKPASEPRVPAEAKAPADAGAAAAPGTAAAIEPPGNAPAAPAPSGFVVQLAAFSDDKGANALANKLKRSNYAAFVEPVNTSRGTLWRVRVGGYATRAEANAARAQLKDEGYSGIVTAAK